MSKLVSLRGIKNPEICIEKEDQSTVSVDLWKVTQDLESGYAKSDGTVAGNFDVIRKAFGFLSQAESVEKSLGTINEQQCQVLRDAVEQMVQEIVAKKANAPTQPK